MHNLTLDWDKKRVHDSAQVHLALNLDFEVGLDKKYKKRNLFSFLGGEKTTRLNVPKDSIGSFCRNFSTGHIFMPAFLLVGNQKRRERGHVNCVSNSVAFQSVIEMDVTAAVFTSSEVKARTKKHPENLISALKSSLKEKDVIEIIASSGARILFNKKLLLLFSRTVRQCLGCEAPSSITLVDINIGALKKVKEILENNVHDVATRSSQDDIEEVVEAARALGIEMSNVRMSASMGNTKRIRNKSLSKAPHDSLALSRYSSLKTSVSTANMAPGPDNIMENDQDMSYDGERPLEISVDVSSDEEDFDDEDTEEYETALEGTMFRSNRSEATLLNDDLDNLDEEERRVSRKRLNLIRIMWRKSAFLSSLA